MCKFGPIHVNMKTEKTVLLLQKTILWHALYFLCLKS